MYSVRRHHAIELGLVERRRRAPVVVIERLAIRPAERIAAGLGDCVDEPAAEAAELGGDARGGDGRLLQRILDVQRERLAAQVLGDHHAVDGKEAFIRHRAGDRVPAIGAGGMHRRPHQDRGIERAIRRQRRHQFLTELRRDRRGLDERRGAGDDVDGLDDAADRHRFVERDRLRACHTDLPLERLKTTELEHDRVVAWRQQRDDEVTVHRRDDRAVALEARRCGGHRRAGQWRLIRRENTTRDRARRHLRACGGGEEDQRDNG